MARAPAFGGAQQGGFSQPGGPGAQLAPNYGTPQNQAVLDQFETLTLGPAAPGQPGDAGKPLRRKGLLRAVPCHSVGSFHVAVHLCIQRQSDSSKHAVYKHATAMCMNGHCLD